MARVAVIDLGKSNSKVALVDTDSSRELHVFTTPARVVDSGPYPHIDHAHIEAFLVDSLAKLASSGDVDALMVATHGATGALIDSKGELALPVMDYEFSGVDQLRDEYERIRPAFAETGSPALPGGLNLGAQLYWQQQRFPEAFDTVSTILTWPQYWVHWLSGARLNDATSLGCHTDLYRPTKRVVSSLLARTDWQARMPPVANSGHFAAPLHDAISKRTGLPMHLPVHVGIHDSNASLVPYLGEGENPFSVLSTGTWVIAMAIGGHEVVLNEHRDSLLNVNAKGAAVPSARFMGGREHDELLKSCNTKSLNDKDVDGLIVQLMQKGVFVMPSHVEGTGPYPQHRGCWLGHHALLSDAERVCAVGLYLALMSEQCLNLIGAQGMTHVEGPMAHNSVFAQMLAAASGRAVTLSTSMTGTSAGAAMLIARPVGESSNILVESTVDRRRLLIDYASRWREQIMQHADNSW
ncbi:FGGY-family carbohydrate kinase [Granulosicoccus antarcticus]|uniref:L-fuculokinase n=1 Tax=Granulosicoccus antarcticus IMCC3135 TaxID=1192854 RepID=A0A2Z2P3B6_9GAMM|nr:FGGY family carbohydrate kinase [Granulosicoccus antarcticus]ASJ74264.1 L-fuculokinase [Granulosicoccus antarcticus IMCC3135]